MQNKHMLLNPVFNQACRRFNESTHISNQTWSLRSLAYQDKPSILLHAHSCRYLDAVFRQDMTFFDENKVGGCRVGDRVNEKKKCWFRVRISDTNRWQGLVCK